MNQRPQESNVHELRKAIPPPAGLTLLGNQRTVFFWLSVHPGRFYAATIAGYATLNTSTTRTALNALVDRGIIQIEQWNDENHDPLYSLAAVS